MGDREIGRYVCALTLVSAIVGVGGWLILHNFLPTHSFPTYYIIPIFFYIVGLLIAFVYKRFKPESHHKLLMLHSAVRMAKMVLSILFLLIYCVIQGQYIKEFLFVFVIYYLIFLVFEAVYFFDMERKRKRRAENRINDNPAK